MRRREKFIVSSFILSLALLGIQYTPLEYRYIAIVVFFLFAYLISAWALYDDLYGVEWITIIPFPAIYSVAVALFYFLLPPDNVLSRLFILGLFGVGIYALFLTSNIFSVAKARTIQLLRAAHTIGFFFMLITSTLLTNFLFSLHLEFWYTLFLLFFIHFPLILMVLWSVELQPKLDKKVLVSSAFFSLSVAELGTALSFFPMNVAVSSLVITSFLYVIVGLLQSHFQQRMFRNTIIEYISFGGLVLLSFLFLLEWK